MLSRSSQWSILANVLCSFLFFFFFFKYHVSLLSTMKLLAILKWHCVPLFCFFLGKSKSQNTKLSEFSRWQAWEKQTLTICWGRAARPCRDRQRASLLPAPRASGQPAPPWAGRPAQKLSVRTRLHGCSCAAARTQGASGGRSEAGTMVQKRHTEVPPMPSRTCPFTSETHTLPPRMCACVCVCVAIN